MAPDQALCPTAAGTVDEHPRVSDGVIAAPGENRIGSGCFATSGSFTSRPCPVVRHRALSNSGPPRLPEGVGSGQRSFVRSGRRSTSFVSGRALEVVVL